MVVGFGSAVLVFQKVTAQLQRGTRNEVFKIRLSKVDFRTLREKLLQGAYFGEIFIFVVRRLNCSVLSDSHS